MNLNVLIEKKQDGGAIASVLEFPAYQVEAESRDLALAALQKLVTEQLAAAEVVPLQINFRHESVDGAEQKSLG